MATSDRIIPAVIHNDGSVTYSSVTSHESDTTPGVCYMIPMRVIPVIFVPGIMGSNLKSTGGNQTKSSSVWSVNSKLSISKQWFGRGAATRKELLDPRKTEVDSDGDIPTGTKNSEAELRRRGWGEVSASSYAEFLVWLENALHDADSSTDYGRMGLRAELMRELVASAPGVQPLTHEEVALSYKYQFPVHAVGYNWLQSNKDSAEHLDKCINKFTKYYRETFGYMCDKVIIVTHSMGGLVARYYSEVLSGYANVLGIVHGVMPAIGAAAAYKRVKAGTEGIAGPVLGANAAEVTAVFVQSAGALQLLPDSDYGAGWLTVQDFERSVHLPFTSNPYKDIYLQKDKWWGLVDDTSINPIDFKKATVDKEWERFSTLISRYVQPFHSDISRKYHANTYAFYGDDVNHKTWGNVIWKRTRRRHFGGVPMPEANVSDPLVSKAIWNKGLGQQMVSTDSTNTLDAALFTLQDADEQGDGTVPVRSGNAPAGKRGVQVCVPYPGIEHEGAYKSKSGQRFALWAIVKIAYRVKQTSMAYKT
jgi:hypothetical protein